jgi:CBS domain-containing protein
MNNNNLIGGSMDHQVRSCRSSDSLGKAAHFMWEKNCGWLPVVNADAVVVGVVTDSDIRCATLEFGIQLTERVGVVMTRTVVPVRAGHVIHDMEKLMQWSHLNRFPVLDDEGHLVGVTTLRDAEPRDRSELEPMAFS